MFELSIALKYLIPKKKHLSVTLIAMMSTGVISLVVWLLLVFLSVTEGMESSWLKKLTDLNAPIRITPTEKYFSSYYYKADAISSSSNFSLKTLEEKISSLRADPYDPEEDIEPPGSFPIPDLDGKGNLIDPVKGLKTLLEKESSLSFQDYEMSGATLKLQLLRSSPTGESLNFLTQVSYLSTPPSEPKVLSSLMLEPTAKDINHLFFLAGYRMENTLSNGQPDVHRSQEEFRGKITSLLKSIEITSVKTLLPQFELQMSALPAGKSFTVYALFNRGSISRIILPVSASEPISLTSSKGTSIAKGTLKAQKDGSGLVFIEGKTFPVDKIALSITKQLTFAAKVNEESGKNASNLKDITLELQGTIQGHTIKTTSSWQGVAVETFSMKSPLQAPEGSIGILLPKAFRENGVLLGDKGFLSYTSSTTSALQEQRSSIFIEGFYDPGILPIGNKCLLVPRTITRTINSANTSFTFDKIALNGFQVWFDDLKNTSLIKAKIEGLLQDEGISSYWKVVSFKEYDFAKDLLQQFQSDKYLFSLVGIIILIVACCNILSFLVILVNDKKKEIAILQAIGASKKSIALIFGVSGMVIGILGSAIGIVAAILTLKNIDLLMQFLSAIQGRDAFQEAFYGTTLPSALSSHALVFTLIATPILSLLAGLIPALKACKLHPSSILRAES